MDRQIHHQSASKEIESILQQVLMAPSFLSIVIISLFVDWKHLQNKMCPYWKRKMLARSVLLFNICSYSNQGYVLGLLLSSHILGWKMCWSIHIFIICTVSCLKKCKNCVKKCWFHILNLVITNNTLKHSFFYVQKSKEPSSITKGHVYIFKLSLFPNSVFVIAVEVPNWRT